MKRILGILGLLALAGTAQAQNNSVKLSGLIDAYVGSVKNAGDPKHMDVVNGSGMSTSYFGFSGVEDLGGGLSAYFNLNAFIRNDTGAAGRFNGDPLFARDSNVGLSSRWGVIEVGRSKSPNFLPSVFANPLGDSFTFSPLILHENISTSGWGFTTTPSDTGWANSITLSTPNLSGLIATVQGQFGEQTNNNRKGNLGANFLYNTGPFGLVGFYERDQISDPIPSLLTTTVGGATVPVTKRDWMLGGSYDPGFMKVFASYGQSKANVNSYLAKTSQAGVSVPANAGGFVLFDVAQTSVGGSFSGSRLTGTLGYDYFMSKRTDLYAMGMRDHVTTLANAYSLAVGIRTRF